MNKSWLLWPSVMALTLVGLAGCAEKDKNHSAPITVTLTSDYDWLAFADGPGGSWQVIATAPGTFNVIVKDAKQRYALAGVCEMAGGETEVDFFYLTPDLYLNGLPLLQGCSDEKSYQALPEDVQVNATIVNGGATTEILAVHDNAYAQEINDFTGTTATLRAAPYNFFARTGSSAGQGFTADKYLIFRNTAVDAANNTLTFDFNAPEAITPAAPVSVQIANPDNTASYTLTASFADQYDLASASGTQLTFQGIPAASILSGEGHLIMVAYPDLLQSSTGVYYYKYLKAPRDLQLTLPSPQTTDEQPAITAVPATTHPRLSFTVPRVTDPVYGSPYYYYMLVLDDYIQAGVTSHTMTSYFMAPTWFEAQSEIRFEPPDLSQLTGWKNTWGQNTLSVNWVFYVGRFIAGLPPGPIEYDYFYSAETEVYYKFYSGMTTF